MTEGHAQELKTQALALKVGKRLRVMISDNNAGIDDSLIGGVIDREVQRLPPGRSVDLVRLERLPSSRRQRLRAGRGGAEDAWSTGIRRIAGRWRVIGKTMKGYWPAAVERQDSRRRRSGGGLSQPPYAMKMNSEYFVALAATFEQRYGVEFQGIRDGAVKDPRERLIQFKTNIDVVMSRARSRTGSATGWPIGWSTIGEPLTDELPLRDRRSNAGSVPGRSAARGESAGRAAEGDGHQRGVGREEGGRRSRSSARRARWPARGAASPRSSSG